MICFSNSLPQKVLIMLHETITWTGRGVFWEGKSSQFKSTTAPGVNKRDPKNE